MKKLKRTCLGAGTALAVSACAAGTPNTPQADAECRPESRIGTNVIVEVCDGSLAERNAGMDDHESDRLFEIRDVGRDIGTSRVPEAVCGEEH